MAGQPAERFDVGEASSRSNSLGSLDLTSTGCPEGLFKSRNDQNHPPPSDGFSAAQS